MSRASFLGIDFSGGAGPWRPVCASPTVWIATIRGAELLSLLPVQQLAGSGEPFTRLVGLLKAGRYRAAAIDAPFSLPDAYMPIGGHPQLLHDIARMDPAADRPFPHGADIINYVSEYATLLTPKPSRLTEKEHGATRSTLWNGPRPGAPFTAACLTLLSQTERPIWPWRDSEGMLVEAFPAAQLRVWGLPSTSYTAPEAGAARRKIIRHLETSMGLIIGSAQRRIMRQCADALDAVLAAYGARAASLRKLRFPPPPTWKTEGAIAVHI